MKTKTIKLTAAFIAAFLLFSFIPRNTASAASERVRNEVLVYDFLVGKLGLNTAATCGILANIECESAFDPLSVSDRGQSLGLVQWNTDRKTAMIDYCNANGYDYKSVDGQLHYLEYDLTVNYKSVYNYIRSVTNNASGAYDAAYHWCYYFERPTNKAVKSVQRGNLAKDTYWPRYSAQNGEAINTSGELTFNNYKIGFSRVLRLQGEYMTGIDVMHIQVKLANLGYSVDTDGIYGRDTAAIVRQFQSDRGMDADGICGQSTWNAITSAAGKSTKATTKKPTTTTTTKKATTTTTAAIKKTATAVSLKITKNPSNVSLTSGETGKFTVAATGTGLKYQWYYKKAGASSWSIWKGHTTATTSGVSNDTWDGMMLKCVVKDSSGKTAESKTATVSVKIPLSITSQPASVTVKSGTTVKFTVKARGKDLTYQWYYKKAGASSWSIWKGHTTATTSAKANDTWNGMQVRCAVIDSSGNKVSSRAAVVTLKK